MSRAEPLTVTTGCYPLWFREDLPREWCAAYWRGPHGQIANANPAMDEYLQHHFAKDGHGFWPRINGVGVEVPADWRMDGVTEVRLTSLIAGIRGRLFNLRANIIDEQNLFRRTLSKLSDPRGSLWWTGRHQPDTGFRAAVFLRARSTMGKKLGGFLRDQLGPALLGAGANELRAHIFASGPGSRLLWMTPNVCHDEPADRRYDAMLLIGAQSKAALAELLASPTLAETRSAQAQHLLSAHAYAIDHTYPLVLDQVRQPSPDSAVKGSLA